MIETKDKKTKDEKREMIFYSEKGIEYDGYSFLKSNYSPRVLSLSSLVFLSLV